MIAFCAPGHGPATALYCMVTGEPIDKVIESGYLHGSSVYLVDPDPVFPLPDRIDTTGHPPNDPLAHLRGPAVWGAMVNPRQTIRVTPLT